MLPPADPETGKCSDGARLRVTNVIRRPGSREQVETIELCGPNAGQHLYLDVAGEGQGGRLGQIKLDTNSRVQ